MYLPTPIFAIDPALLAELDVQYERGEPNVDHITFGRLVLADGKEKDGCYVVSYEQQGIVHGYLLWGN